MVVTCYLVFTIAIISGMRDWINTEYRTINKLTSYGSTSFGLSVC